MTLPPSCRRGVSLIELLMVVVLGGFIVLATYQVLITNSRIDAVNTARITGQQNLRAGMAVLYGELREISPGLGDLVAMGGDSLTIRAQRAYGLVCGVDYSPTPPEVTAVRVGPWFQPGDSIFVFHDNDPLVSSDDAWHVGTVSAVDSVGETCGGMEAQVLSLPLLTTTASASPTDSVRVGGPLRGFDTYTYGLYTIEGEPYLGRRLSSASTPDPLVGPLVPTRGVSFRYLDTVGAVTTTDTQVAQIEVILRYLSEARDAANQPVGDSIVLRIFPRN